MAGWQGVKGHDRRQRVRTLRSEKGTPGQRCWGLGFSLDSGSLWFGEQGDAHPLACGNPAHWRVGGSHLSTNSTRETRRTSGASGTL